MSPLPDLTGERPDTRLLGVVATGCLFLFFRFARSAVYFRRLDRYIPEELQQLSEPELARHFRAAQCAFQSGPLDRAVEEYRYRAEAAFNWAIFRMASPPTTEVFRIAAGSSSRPLLMNAIVQLGNF